MISRVNFRSLNLFCVMISAFVGLIAMRHIVAQGAPLDPPKEYIIEGLSVELSPGKTWFAYTDDIYLLVRIQNTTGSSRYLGVSAPTKREDAPRTTVLQINSKKKEIEGLPCYVHVRHDMGWHIRLNENGYSDRYKSSIELKPGDKMLFRVNIPSFGDNRNRPIGRFSVFSRFSVSIISSESFIVANGPELSIMIVDKTKLDNAVEMVKSGLDGHPKKKHDIESAIRTIANNPLPQHAPLVLRAIQHKWFFQNSIQWTMWYTASQFVDMRIYKAAIAEAKNPNIGRAYAYLVYRTIYRNRVFLRRKDVLAILENPKLEDSAFLNVYNNNDSVYPTLFLALVAQEQDIERLADLCARFLPVRISHDKSHATFPDRRLAPIREAFMRYPGSSKDALRQVLIKGMKHSDFKPWAHEFSIGNIPRPLVLFGEWLAELKDVNSIPIFKYYAENPLVHVSNTMQDRAPAMISQIDGTESMKALRRLHQRGILERVKLGDPVAIDVILAEARELVARRDHTNRQGYSLLTLVLSVLEPDEKHLFKSVGDGTRVEQLWKKRRAEFVNAFVKKYGFNPDAPGTPGSKTK